MHQIKCDGIFTRACVDTVAIIVNEKLEQFHFLWLAVASCATFTNTSIYIMQHVPALPSSLHLSPVSSTDVPNKRVANGAVSILRRRVGYLQFDLIRL